MSIPVSWTNLFANNDRRMGANLTIYYDKSITYFEYANTTVPWEDRLPKRFGDRFPRGLCAYFKPIMRPVWEWQSIGKT